MILALVLALVYSLKPITIGIYRLATIYIAIHTGTVMKEVLLVYGDRKRPVIFRASPGDPSAEQKNLYDAVRVVFEDILATAEGSSSTCHEKFYLEFESDEWGGEMVDVSGSIVIPDKAIVYLRKPSCARKEIKDATVSVVL